MHDYTRMISPAIIFGEMAEIWADHLLLLSEDFLIPLAHVCYLSSLVPPIRIVA